MFAIPLPYWVLALAIVLVWFPARWRGDKVSTWPFAFIVSLALALTHGYLDGRALLFLLLLWTSAHLYALRLLRSSPHRVLDYALWTIVVGLSLALALHVAPGFNNTILVPAQRVTPEAVPYRLFANFDKGAAGLILLAYFGKRIVSLTQFVSGIRVWLASLSMTLAVLLPTGIFAGFMAISFKVPPFWMVFVFVNLFFVCVAEEAFFRGLIQERLHAFVARSSNPRWQHYLVLVVVAIMFGAVHSLSPIVVVLFSFAGLGYAFAYWRSQSIECSIATHFTLNCIHFFCFTYPYLEPLGRTP
jgi:uncharacterized protein